MSQPALEQKNYLYEPQDHAAALHGDRALPRTKISIGFKYQTGKRWDEHAIKIEELQTYCEGLKDGVDVYIAQNPVWGWRGIHNLAGLNACFADLDLYNKPEFQNYSPEALASQVRFHLDDLNIPEPTTIIYSGRGLQCVWLFDKVITRKALPRWNAAQKYLCKALQHFCADPRAIDGARVLRLYGTRHSFNGEVVRPLTGGDFKNTYDFEFFINEVFPMSHDEWKAHVVNLQTEREKKLAGKLKASEVEAFFARSNLRYSSAADLWTARYYDIKKLMEIRSMPLFSEHRDRMDFGGFASAAMFLMGSGMTYMAPPAAMRREMSLAGKAMFGWNERDTKSTLSKVYKTGIAAAKGERVEKVVYTVEGNECVRLNFDPRYRFKNSTIIEMLKIKKEEMRQLSTIIDRDEKLRRKREKARLERGSYEKKAGKQFMIQAAKDMAAEGKSQAEIAEFFGKNQSTVSRWIKSQSIEK